MTTDESQASKKYYAIAGGRSTGIYNTWMECEEHIIGFKGVKVERFSTKREAEQYLLENIDGGESQQYSYSKPHISPYPIKRFVDAESSKIDSDSVSFENAVVVQTAGYCEDNGYPYAKAGYGVFWEKESPNNKCGSVKSVVLDNKIVPPTNNRAELTAAIVAVQQVKDDTLPLIIKCDSPYVYNTMSQFVHRWEEKGYIKKDGGVPANKDLIHHLYTLTREIPVRFDLISRESNSDAHDLSKKGCISSVKDENVKEETADVLSTDIQDISITSKH